MPLWHSIIVLLTQLQGHHQAIKRMTHGTRSYCSEHSVRSGHTVGPQTGRLLCKSMKQCLHVAGLQEAVHPLREPSGAAQP